MQILLVAPSFFGYRERIKNEMMRQGHSVTCVDDRPSENVTFKSLAKISYNLVDYKIEKYVNYLRYVLLSSDYDLVLFMGGMSFCFSRAQFQVIRKACNSRFVAYLWDSFANCQRFGKCFDLFDDVFSFEPVDCKRYNLKFRPLFYSDVYSSLPLVPESGFEYDACFVGSVHQPSKFHMIHGICQDLEAMGKKVFKFFYLPSKSVEFIRKIGNPIYRGVDFQHCSLSALQIAEIYSLSKVIIDSPQSGQFGLTMRTLETVGARRKLITSNSDIVNYDFADNNNVAIWHGRSTIDSMFFDTEYVSLPKKVYESYSIQSFVETLLNGDSEFQGYKKG
ncbi:hypothetical protein [Bifidobacterium longum]|uniref:hypothetical protein n=1 Tax=Bifidobacterium longum TaxID=216816 RepID=UPI000CAB470A|nr:hypothetical protein [Bifidobacterium longum]PKD10928.1 hypothetical protein APC1465_0386 [Bifidobacterium longum]